MTATDTVELDYAGDPIGDLRLPELRVANATLSRTLGKGIDCATEISEDGQHKWDAMAHVAWVLAKRTDPEAQLGRFTAMRLQELANLLVPRQPAAPAEPPADAEPPTLDQLEEEARQDPTDPTA